MNLPRLPDKMQTTYSNAQLEHISLLLAAASRMPGAPLPSALPGMANNAFAGPSSIKPSSSPGGDVTERAKSSLPLPPDGNNSSKYPEPDIEGFIYDPTAGYRFDPSTGLHYDANSCLFVNKKLGVLLRYEKLTNTYERAGSIADICAPVLVKEFAELMGYDANQRAVTNTTEASRKLMTPPPPSPPEAPHPPSPPEAPPPPSFSPNQFSRLWSADNRRMMYEEISPCTDSPFSQREPSRSTNRGGEYSKYSPSPLSDSEWSPSPERGRSSPGEDCYSRGRSSSPVEDRYSSANSDRILRRNSSTERPASHKARKPYSRSRSNSIISPQRKHRSERSRSRSEGHGKERDDDVDFKKTLDSIARIHERNLRDPDNSFSRFIPRTFKLTQKSELKVIMVTPLPPKGNREWADLELLFKGILRANAVSYDRVSVQPQDNNAPCDYVIIRFKNPQDATRWYLLHEGALELANPDGSKCTSFMYFSNPPWKCGFCLVKNFPLRFFCYRCLKPKEIQTRRSAEVPITEFTHHRDMLCGSKWVALKHLDHRITSIEGVLDMLPPLPSFGIKTCELMTEESGIPLGWCVFEMNDKPSAKEFHAFLQKKHFNPVFVLINSRRGLANNQCPMDKTASNSKQQSKPGKSTKSKTVCTQTLVSLVSIKLADYIVESRRVDIVKPNHKGTQTLLVYKNL